MLVQDENGKEIFAESWYLNYDLTKFKPHTYKFGLKIANSPKISTRKKRSKNQILK